MSTIFARTHQAFSKKNINQHFLIPKRWETGGQYTGYVSYFNKEKLNGYIIREDAPENSYRFSASDLSASTVPQVRKFQQVAFQGQQRQSGLVAKDVTALNGEPLTYSFANLKIPLSNKTKLLSSVEGFETTRFRGVVRRILEDKNAGFICPVDIGYKDLYFEFSELQTTGREYITEGSEVEFLARPRKANPIDRAVCITRPGGGLITEDTQDIGKTRRLLGAMYKESDTEARIPSEFTNGDTEQREGYVWYYDMNRSHGFILPFDKPTEQVYVSIDDCHIFGKRALRRYQHVEFYANKTNSGEMRAFHVCAPGKRILRYTTPNQYTLRSDSEKSYEPDSGFHKGQVAVVSKEKNYFFIRPDEEGYGLVFATNNSVSRMNYIRLEQGHSVEFTVVERANKTEEGQTVSQLAGEVTAGGGRPFCGGKGSYRNYLVERFDFAKAQRDLPECPLKEKGEHFNGWISGFSKELKKGTIEIEAPPGQRYRKVTFDIKGAVLGDQIMSEGVTIRNGTEVKVELRPISQEKSQTDDDEREHVLTQEAFNVISRHSNILRLDKEDRDRQRYNRFNQPQDKKL